MEILVQNLRYSMRPIARAPGFAPAVTAIGVGANAATFSVAEFVLLRPLPYPDPDSLVRLCEGPRTGSCLGCMNQFSPANHRDVAAGVARGRRSADVRAMSGLKKQFIQEVP